MELMVDPNQGFVPRIRSRVAEDGTIHSPELDDMYPFLPEAEIESIRSAAQRIESLPGGMP